MKKVVSYYFFYKISNVMIKIDNTYKIFTVANTTHYMQKVIRTQEFQSTKM